MSAIFDAIGAGWSRFIAMMSQYNLIIDTLDILIVAYVIYKVVQIVRQTRAKQLIYGVVLLVSVWIVSGWLGMRSVSALLQGVFSQGVLAVAIIFQPEIRSALELVSRSNLGTLIKGGAQSHGISDCISSVCSACQSFQSSKTGALIVFERDTKLGDIIGTGTIVNADASPEILGNIFFINTPLHDGAMIIRDGRIAAAGCILPLTRAAVNKSLGTRHRAAIGMSEVSDAMVVVVSEETGTISVAVDGRLERGFNHLTLKERLIAELMPANDQQDNRSLWRRLFKGGKK